MAETRGNTQCPVRGGSGRKIAYAIPKKGICDSAKRDMRFFIMGGAFFGYWLLAIGFWPLAEG